MFKKILLLLLIFYISLPILATDNSKEKKALAQELQKNQTQLAKKKAEQKQTKKSLSYLKRELYIENKKLASTKRKLKYSIHKSKKTEKKLKQTKSELQKINKKVSNRLKALYQQENLGIISFLFAPKDYETALTHSYYFEKLLETDAKLLEKLQTKQLQYKKEKESLESQQYQIYKLKKDISNRKRRLSRKKTAVQYSLNEIEKDIAEFEKLNNLLKEESAQFEGIIKSKGSSIKRFLASGVFQRPTKGWISSRYGYRRHPIFKRRILHAGIDFAAPKGKPIYAADNGRVIFSGWKKGYGNVIIIDHGWKNNKNYSTLYAHQSRRIVTKGTTVKKGKLIGYVGSTGYSTGPHLHFELRENGRPINPTKFLKL